MAAVKTRKKELRKHIKSVLSGLSDASISSQTSNAVKTLLSMPEYQSAKRIGVYLSMPSGEISTSTIVHDALKQGKKVFIPYTYKLATSKDGQPKSIMDMLELQSLQDFESLQPDSWGIPTPSEDSVSSRANSFGGKGLTNGEVQVASGQGERGLDLVIVPGMAFDFRLDRLGHGKGFYDYFLQRCHQVGGFAKAPFRVGLALKEQFLPNPESVPTDSTDHRLHALVIGDGQLLRLTPRI